MASGKTQLCHQLCVQASLVRGEDVVYVDTCGAFAPTRLLAMALAAGLHGDQAVIDCLAGRVRRWGASTLDELADTLQAIDVEITSAAMPNIGLVIVDCLASLLAPLLGAGPLAHARMLDVARQLRSLALTHNLLVIVTNNTVSSFEPNGAIKPALGRTWSYVPDVRILLSNLTKQGQAPGEEGAREQLVARLLRSTHAPVDFETRLVLSEAGVQCASSAASGAPVVLSPPTISI